MLKRTCNSTSKENSTLFLPLPPNLTLFRQMAKHQQQLEKIAKSQKKLEVEQIE